MSIELTVLIPTRNRGRILRTTLAAMSRVRTSQLSVQFVVIDNGSTDDTRAVLREFESKLPLRCATEPNAGKSRALNRVLHEVNLGDIVVFTDDDVTPDESWFEAIVAACERWPNHSVFGGRIDPEWPSKVAPPAWALHPAIQGMVFAAHHVSDNEREYPSNFEPFGPNYWVRRDALAGARFAEHIGPHPTRRTLCDETVFLKQLRSRGFAPVYSPHARVRHRIEAERMTKASLYRRAIQLGRGRVHSEGSPAGDLLLQSRAAWGLRIGRLMTRSVANLLRAGLVFDEERRCVQIVSDLCLLAACVESLRSAPRRPSDGRADPTVLRA